MESSLEKTRDIIGRFGVLRRGCSYCVYSLDVDDRGIALANRRNGSQTMKLMGKRFVKRKVFRKVF